MSATPYRQVPMAQEHDHCPKCGWEGSPYVRWCRQQPETNRVTYTWCKLDSATEHLDATCPCCGFMWRKECVKPKEGVG